MMEIYVYLTIALFRNICVCIVLTLSKQMNIMYTRVLHASAHPRRPYLHAHIISRNFYRAYVQRCENP